MTIHEANQKLIFQLSNIYDERESNAIVDWVMEHLTGWKRIDRRLNNKVTLSTEQIQELIRIEEQLMLHKPVQYILNEAWFRGMKLYVDENVLIPRPETEELVEWALTILQEKNVAGSKIKILDVGTGSGCIPIAMKKAIGNAEVYACDLSEGALAVARRNAEEQKVIIQFEHLDFLDPKNWERFPSFDLILSNPPYIAEEEKIEIDKHVIEYEPHLALFVPTQNSLIFYEHLARFGGQYLNPGGMMLMEIHYAKGKLVHELLRTAGFDVSLKQDLTGKDRMVRAEKI